MATRRIRNCVSCFCGTARLPVTTGRLRGPETPVQCEAEFTPEESGGSHSRDYGLFFGSAGQPRSMTIRPPGGFKQSPKTSGSEEESSQPSAMDQSSCRASSTPAPAKSRWPGDHRRQPGQCTQRSRKSAQGIRRTADGAGARWSVCGCSDLGWSRLGSGIDIRVTAAASGQR